MIELTKDARNVFALSTEIRLIVKSIQTRLLAQTGLNYHSFSTVIDNWRRFYGSGFCLLCFIRWTYMYDVFEIRIAAVAAAVAAADAISVFLAPYPRYDDALTVLCRQRLFSRFEHIRVLRSFDANSHWMLRLKNRLIYPFPLSHHSFTLLLPRDLREKYYCFTLGENVCVPSILRDTRF